MSPLTTTKFLLNPALLLEYFGEIMILQTDTINTDGTDRSFQQFLAQLLGYTNGRPHATTTEFAHLVGRAQQTIRKNYCLTGNAFGVAPIKVGNRLLWPIDDIAHLLATGDVK